MIRFGRSVVNSKMPNVTAAEEIALALTLRDLGHEVIIFSGWTPDRDDYDGILILSVVKYIDQVNTCDGMVVWNWLFNYFGGEEYTPNVFSQRAVIQFKGPMLMYFNDPGCLNPFWHYDRRIHNHPWMAQYPAEEYWNFAGKTFDVLTNFHDLEKVRKILVAKTSRAGDAESERLKFGKVDFMSQAFLSRVIGRSELNSSPRPVDLTWGGSSRGTSKGRREQVEKYCFGNPADIVTEVYGTISLDSFDPGLRASAPPFLGKTRTYAAYLDRLRGGLAMPVFGDSWCADNIVPARLLEAALCGAVPLVEASYDPQKVFFQGDQVLEGFCYVLDKADMVAKVRALKADANLCRDLRARNLAIWDSIIEEEKAQLGRVIVK